MTDTTNIRNAIKGLPEGSLLSASFDERYQVVGTTDDLKALVAENESLKAEVAVLREARLRLFGILGGAESITFDQDRFGYTQDEFGWRHSLDILEDGVEMYDRAEKDVELLNLLSTMPDDIANALTKADGGDDDGK